MISERNLYLSRALGFNQRYPLDAPSLDVPAQSDRTGAMGFGPVMTLYGGALLKPGSDGKLYGIDPDSGREFWSTVLGERLTGSPVAIGLDVFTATDAGKLYTLDIASGAILGETKLSGPVYGSVASDGTNLYAISAAGRLHAVNAAGGRELWSASVATNTESTPAVDGGVVYLADRKGTARAVQSADGKVLWSRELGSEFCRCPVVLPELLVFGCMDGRLTALNRRTGEPVWQTQVDTRFMRYEPVPVLMPPPPDAAKRDAGMSAGGPEVPVLLCLSGGKPLLIEAASGKPAERQIVTGSVQKDGKFKPDSGPLGIGELTAPISFHKGYLAFVPIHGDIADVPMYNDSRYHNMGNGAVTLLRPAWDSAPKQANMPRAIARIEKPVRIDGRLEDGEWGKATLLLDGPADIFPADRRSQGKSDGAAHWTGYDDLGARVYLRCDSNALYVAAAVGDDRHFNSQPRDTIWNGDAMQMGLAVAKTHGNLALALTDGAVVFRQFEGVKDRDLEKTADFSVRRDESQHQTFYELRLPLADLGLKPGDEFGLNACILDDDTGKGPAYWLQTSPGLLGLGPRDPPPGKAAEKVYPRFVLERK
jgi:hypothetical protein